MENFEKRDRTPETKIEGSFENVLQHIFEEVILKEGHRLNEGSKAYIFEVPEDSEELHKLARVLKDAVDDDKLEGSIERVLNSPSIAKLFKFVTDVSGLEEAKKQERARAILEDTSVGAVVKVPEAITLPDQHIRFSKDALDQIRNTHHCDIPEETDFILMEEVDGTDLATWSYQQTIIASAQKEMEINELSESEVLKKLAYQALEYKLINPRNIPGMDRELRGRFMKAAGPIRTQFAGNPSAIIGYIDKWPNEDFRNQCIDYFEIGEELEILRDPKDVGLDSYIGGSRNTNMLESLIYYQHDIFEQDPKLRGQKVKEVIAKEIGYQGRIPAHLRDSLVEAIKVLHKEGFYHRDLHERNIMIGRDMETIYLIDFAEAVEMNSGSDPYTEGVGAGEKYTDDTSIVSKNSLLTILSS